MSVDWSGVIAGFLTPSIVIDDQGRVLASNLPNAELNSTTVERMNQGTIAAFLPLEFVEQTLGVVRRVLEGGAPRSTVNMWKGYWWRCRFWRVQPPGAAAPACAITCDPWRPAIMGGADVSDPEAEELPHHDLGDLESITAREAEVLWLIAQGQSVPEISQTLSRSVKTVESHVRAVSGKLRLSGRVAIAGLARERGLTNMTLEQVRRIFARR